MRLLIAVTLSMSPGCGASGGVEPPSFEEAVDDFVQTGCIDAAGCLSQDAQACEDDVRADLGDAEAELDEAGEAQCAACLEAKVAQIRAVLDAGCDHSVAEQGPVLAVCDLDPSADDDGDGTADNDLDEACAGFP